MNQFKKVVRNLALAAVLVVAGLLWISSLARADSPFPSLPADFMEFWQSSILRLAPWPLDITYEARSGQVEFTGLGGERLHALLVVPAHRPPYAGAVLHIGDSGGSWPAVAPPGDNLIHMYIPWDPARHQTVWSPAGAEHRRQYCLYQAILNNYRAFTVLQSVPGVTPGKVGIIGEGVGGTEALALAALRPGEVCSVIVYQPWPVLPLPGLPAPLVAPKQPKAVPATAYFDPLCFATFVSAPTLIVTGEYDRVTPPPEAARICQALAGPHNLIVVPGLIHQAASLWTEWPEVCRRWTGEHLSRAGQRVLARGLAADLSLFEIE